MPTPACRRHRPIFGTGPLFWRVLPGSGPHPRLNPALGVLYVFTVALQGGILRALMTFSSAPWYPAYAAGVAAWGLTPLEDQQLAGLIMWVPAGLVYLVAALVPLALLLEGADPASRPRENAVPSLLSYR